MICDKCGKSNVSGVSVCSYCGMEMPKSTECNGFADILTVKAAEPTVSVVSEERGKASDTDMKNLLNKTNEIFKNTKFSLAAICICSLISVISIFMTFSTNAKLNEYEKKLDTIIENTSVAEESNQKNAESDAEENESEKGKDAPELFDEEVEEPESKNKFQEMKKNVEEKNAKKKAEQKKAEQKKAEQADKKSSDVETQQTETQQTKVQGTDVQETGAQDAETQG